MRGLSLLSALLAAGLLVAAIATAVEIGEQAPDFTLPSTTGDKISLSQFRGQPVLIEFYAQDFSPVWAANLSARKADYHKFQELNVQILGISGSNPFSQKVFANSLALPYPLLSDRGLEVARTYGVLYGFTAGKNNYPEMKGLQAKRSFFLVDGQGVVRRKWLGEDLDAFPNEELLEAARAIAGKL
jgi:peroxiredoxin Q/BCP